MSAAENVSATGERTKPRVSGVWLPIVTPFVDGAVDFRSYERLLNYYMAQGLGGLIPLGTTGESPTIEDDEIDAIVELTTRVVGNRFPVYVGVGGNSTSKVVRTIRRRT